jgi:hypothetical protein
MNTKSTLRITQSMGPAVGARGPAVGARGPAVGARHVPGIAFVCLSTVIDNPDNHGFRK